MKKRELLDLLSNIDDELLEGVEKDTKSAKVWVKWSALAACLCIVAVIAVGVGMPFFNTDPSDTQSSTESVTPQETPGDQYGLLRIPVVQAGNKIGGKTEINVNNKSSNVTAEISYPGFRIRTVVEVEVVEVLDDLYYAHGGYSSSRWIARLKIKDVVLGSGLPEEIYLHYHSRYGENVFDGYDSFILSLSQIGTEDYMMINQNTLEAEYFPNMFDVYYSANICSGSIIAFSDGVADHTWYSKVACWLFDMNGYPAKEGDTIEQVKGNIRAFVNDENYSLEINTDTEYVSPEMLFESEEAAAIRYLTSPESGNAFLQYLSVNSDRYTVRYERMINGFCTNEYIILTVYSDGSVKTEYGEEGYTESDLEKIPDLCYAIKAIENDVPDPTHIDTVGFSLSGFRVTGKYIKRDGRVWGVVRIKWIYNNDREWSEYLEDDMYYLYDSEGNGRIVERDELRAVIGDDDIILDFKYGTPLYILG